MRRGIELTTFVFPSVARTNARRKARFLETYGWKIAEGRRGVTVRAWYPTSSHPIASRTF
jgi:hypothetical protein